MRISIKLFGFLTASLVFLWPAIGMADAPHELAGIVLGGKLDDHQDKFRPDSVLPIRYLETLKEVEIKEIKGYKVGLVTYATCIEPDRIVRIKLKYADSSKAFYEALLKQYKKRFGEPDEYRGDPFHVVVAWKWHFVDKDDNRISLILQHNTRDEEEKEGNSVKMTMWNLFEAEGRCFQENYDQPREEENAFQYRRGMDVDWDRFVPR